MNYRHIFHAGSFSDVFKHVVLLGLLEALKQKDKPICYLDTHAGIGTYDLLSNNAQKTQEFAGGIVKLEDQANLPEWVADYLTIVRSFNPDSTAINIYPGSPCVAEAVLRAQDRMVLIELHQDDVEQLKQVFWRNKQVAVHRQDAYEALKAHLPPKEKRGLVLIDPSFEKTDEFKQIIRGLKQALQRWQTGVYAIWYPLKDKGAVREFKYQLAKLPIQNCLITELSIYPEDVGSRLYGSGMAIINVPWQFDKMLKQCLPWLWQVLSVAGAGDYKIEWLLQPS